MSDQPPQTVGRPPAWPGTDGKPPPDPGWYRTPYSPTTEPATRSRGPLWAALFIVAVLSGSALFVSGFTLGLQQSLAPGTPSSDRELFEPFWEAWHKVSTEYVGEVEQQTLVEGAIDGLFDALDDPYSSYMTSDEYRNSLSGISGEFEGIGAEMATRDASGASCEPIGAQCQLFVEGVLPDSPAEKGGLRAGDQLVAVNGETVDGSTISDVVQRVKGPKDTAVTLSIVRGGAPQELTLTRDIVRRQEIDARLLADGTVGYLGIHGFSSGSADEFTTKLKEQLGAGARRFIVDVRGNPGGFVDAAVTIASQFVGSGPIYWEEIADGSQRPTEAEPGGVATDPANRVVLLVDGNSASASEILAGALHDTGRATLVGEATFGKGTIQQWHLLGSGDSGGFRLSVAKWLTPDQTWIHGTGVQPDVAVSMSGGIAGTDPQLERALAILAADPTPGPSVTASPMPSSTSTALAHTALVAG
jgi:carboxyl-terminal processing protease